jgi:DNA-binding XRE family transcriptional regulator
LEPVTGVENTRRGENAVLSEEQVREIRRRLGTETQTALAEEFGVSRSCIWDIDHGRSWRDVA